MKTERVTLLTSHEFKAFLCAEAAREGVSVAELVRKRCETRVKSPPDPDEILLAALAGELREAALQAQAALKEGLHEARAAVNELRERRLVAAAAKTTSTKVRKAAVRT